MTAQLRSELFCSECEQDMERCGTCDATFKVHDEGYCWEDGEGHSCQKCQDEFNKRNKTNNKTSFGENE